MVEWWVGHRMGISCVGRAEMVGCARCYLDVSLQSSRVELPSTGLTGGELHRRRRHRVGGHDPLLKTGAAPHLAGDEEEMAW